MTQRQAQPAREVRGRTVRAADTPRSSEDEQRLSRNEVHLVGRVSRRPETRELPSGDVLVTWRLVVDRPAPTRPAPDGVRLPTVDAVACVAWPARLRRTASGLGVGDVVEVTGALRQHFWRTGAVLASRTEVEAASVRRIRRGG